MLYLTEDQRKERSATEPSKRWVRMYVSTFRHPGWYRSSKTASAVVDGERRTDAQPSLQPRIQGARMLRIVTIDRHRLDTKRS